MPSLVPPSFYTAPTDTTNNVKTDDLKKKLATKLVAPAPAPVAIINDVFTIESYTSDKNNGKFINASTFAIESGYQQAISQIIIWDRLLTDVETKAVKGAFSKFIKTSIPFLDSVKLPALPPLQDNDNFVVVNFTNSLPFTGFENMILLAVNYGARSKFIPENITFNSDVNNSYDTVSKTWSTNSKATIVRNKSGTKAWSAVISDNSEIILTAITM